MNQAWEVIAEETDVRSRLDGARPFVSAVVVTDGLSSAVELFLKMYPSLKSMISVQRLSGEIDGVIVRDDNVVDGVRFL